MRASWLQLHLWVVACKTQNQGGMQGRGVQWGEGEACGSHGTSEVKQQPFSDQAATQVCFWC